MLSSRVAKLGVVSCLGMVFATAAKAQTYDSFSSLGNGLSGSGLAPALHGRGTLLPATPWTLAVGGATPSAVGALLVGNTLLNLPFAGGVLAPNPVLSVPLQSDALGNWQGSGTWPAGGAEGSYSYLQAVLLDSAAPAGFAMTNGLRVRTPPLLRGDAWRHLDFDSRATRRYVYPSNPNGGALSALWTIPLGANAIRTGDLNGDGVLDIVVSDQAVVSAFDGNASLLWSSATPGNLDYLGDVDGDGLLEICVSRNVGSSFFIDVLDHNGLLQKQITRPTNPGTYIGVRASFGEFLVVTYGAGYALKPRGAGIFRYSSGVEEAYYDTGGGAHGRNAVGDIDGDGQPDVTLGWFTPHNGASGNGTTDGDLWGVALAANLSAPGAAFSAHYKRIVTAWSPGSNPNGRLHSQLADLNRDGKDEVIYIEGHDAVYYRGTNHVYVVDETGTRQAWTALGANVENFSFAVIEDQNSDGVDEVVVAESVAAGTLWILDGRNLSIVRSAPVGDVLAVADLDGDGAEDIVVYDRVVQSLAILDAATLIAKSSLTVPGLSTFALSDVNGDGVRDLLASTSAGLQVWTTR